MIASFGDPATEALYHGWKTGSTRRLPRNVLQAATRKLDMLHAAQRLGDLRVPPGNRLKALSGDLDGLHSIRINAQWRIVFRWTPAGPAEVRITDDH